MLPHKSTRGQRRREERPAMDHIGIDVHKRESQIYILAEGGEVITTHRSLPSRPHRIYALPAFDIRFSLARTRCTNESARSLAPNTTGSTAWRPLLYCGCLSNAWM